MLDAYLQPVLMSISTRFGTASMSRPNSASSIRQSCRKNTLLSCATWDTFRKIERTGLGKVNRSPSLHAHYQRRIPEKLTTADAARVAAMAGLPRSRFLVLQPLSAGIDE